jgi:hypothetical protein
MINSDEPPMVDNLDTYFLGWVRSVFEALRYHIIRSERLGTHRGTEIVDLAHSVIRDTIQVVHDG